MRKNRKLLKTVLGLAVGATLIWGITTTVSAANGDSCATEQYCQLKKLFVKVNKYS